MKILIKMCPTVEPCGTPHWVFVCQNLHNEMKHTCPAKPWKIYIIDSCVSLFASSSHCCVLPSTNVCSPVPGAPPRKLEVDAINSTAIRVTWKPPIQVKQHGQIRGYQVIFSRLENGEPRGQPNIMDVALPEAQVMNHISLAQPFFPPSLPF